ncbi:hypothetical protein [Arenibacter palladensis]|uniref:hypothetical protein n=1 Tax=Arenibacter palladensis TaxID=237373 RepID=UPI0026E129EA|nr:hypothetical protein [Arenibacter palladensis]MDO6603174.1 hypothetical protein [Arenibacter palladensis]
MKQELLTNSMADYGNLAIGAGTIFLGIIVLIVNSRNSNRDRKIHVANKRQEWIREFRNAVSTFQGEIEVVYELASSTSSEIPYKYMQSLYRSMNEIIMMVYSDDDNSTELLEKMSEVLVKAKKGDST